MVLGAGLVLASCDGGNKPGKGGQGVEPDPVQLPEAQQLDSIPYNIILANPVQAQLGLHSYAYATHQGKWLLVGGRTNGFHRTSTPASTFPSATANDSLRVLNPSTGQVLSAPVPESMRWRLSVTNLQFYQEAGILFLVGGYGSTCEADYDTCYQTFPYLTAIKVPPLIAAIESQQYDQIEQNIVSIEDEAFRVTGGFMKKLGDYYYLVFGQDYFTKYQPGVSGRYTNAVSRFKISFDGTNLGISDYSVVQDTARGDSSQYHRRDLSVVSSILPGQKPGITVYGGVFTPQDLAWQHPVYISDENDGGFNVTVDTDFTQYWNLYECAHVLLYDPTVQGMYTTLLGGITYKRYGEDNEVIEDPQLPWSRTISTVVLDGTGHSFEQPQGPDVALSMPGFMGANGFFEPNEGVALYDAHDIIDYSQLQGDSVVLGKFYGGIKTSSIQVINRGSSVASDMIYDVVLVKKR